MSSVVYTKLFLGTLDGKQINGWSKIRHQLCLEYLDLYVRRIEYDTNRLMSFLISKLELAHHTGAAWNITELNAIYLRLIETPSDTIGLPNMIQRLEQLREWSAQQEHSQITDSIQHLIHELLNEHARELSIIQKGLDLSESNETIRIFESFYGTHRRWLRRRRVIICSGRHADKTGTVMNWERNKVRIQLDRPIDSTRTEPPNPITFSVDKETQFKLYP